MTKPDAVKAVELILVRDDLVYSSVCLVPNYNEDFTISILSHYEPANILHTYEQVTRFLEE